MGGSKKGEEDGLNRSLCSTGGYNPGHLGNLVEPGAVSQSGRKWARVMGSPTRPPMRI